MKTLVELMPIHGVKWAGQPDIELYCSGWLEAAWSQPTDLPSGCYLGENDGDRAVYTFDTASVTCEWCKRSEGFPVTSQEPGGHQP